MKSDANCVPEAIQPAVLEPAEISRSIGFEVERIRLSASVASVKITNLSLPTVFTTPHLSRT